ncbi:MAG: hypothetical protein IJ197_07185 [Bacteroidaceae bacterium]|nr:hypothetical protein [Bacteroidaceae bacterium]
MKNLFFVLVPLLLCMACSKPLTDEEQGRQMLLEARAHYAGGRYGVARDTILSMRQRFPMALEARTEAILLLDSIELQLAGDDTLKAEFYRRKLAFDIERTNE